MTVVYLDRVVLLNLAVDYLLLLATARLAGLPLRRGRLALAAALGALYAAAVFLPGCRMLAHPACRLAAGVAVCRLAWRRERRPWRLTALFFLLSGALAGCCWRQVWRQGPRGPFSAGYITPTSAGRCCWAPP